MQSLRIGISIGLQQAGESMWTNGIKQNALFLAKVLQASTAGHEVILLNTTNVDLTKDLAWDINEFNTKPFMEFLDSDDNRLDVFIELGGQISVENMLRLKAKGCRTISYCCGVEYLYLIEKMVNGVECWSQGLLVNKWFDAIWCVPQVYEHSGPFLENLRRAPARPIPFVWDPMVVESRAAQFPNRNTYFPKEGDGPGKRISIMEPNINVVKTCIFPIMITDEVYRRAPELIEFMNVVGGKRWAENSKDFNQLMNHMDIVHGHKATFIDRHDTPSFLANHTDVVVSHQIFNALNYFYFDVCWQGYPLIHNADMCQDLGYYYPQSQVKEGAKQLEWVLRNHDSVHEEYTTRQRANLLKYTSRNPRLVQQYDELLTELMNAPRENAR